MADDSQRILPLGDGVSNVIHIHNPPARSRAVLLYIVLIGSAQLPDQLVPEGSQTPQQ